MLGAGSGVRRAPGLGVRVAMGGARDGSDAGVTAPGDGGACSPDSGVGSPDSGAEAVAFPAPPAHADADSESESPVWPRVSRERIAELKSRVRRLRQAPSTRRCYVVVSGGAPAETVLAAAGAPAAAAAGAPAADIGWRKQTLSEANIRLMFTKVRVTPCVVLVLTKVRVTPCSLPLGKLLQARCCLNSTLQARVER